MPIEVKESGRPEDLSALVGSVVARVPGLHLTADPGAVGYHRIGELSAETLAEWLADQGRQYKNMDRKVRAAYLMGSFSYAIGQSLGALYLLGSGLPAMGAGDLSARQVWYGWEYEGQTGEALRFELKLDGALAGAPMLDNAGLRQLLEAMHEGLVEALRPLSGLSRSALWRQAADGIAAGMLDVGKASGSEARAIAEAEALVRAPGSPLANRQTGFVEIVVRDEAEPGRIIGCEWFRARGGCCRYYTIPDIGAEYCSTCVLRKPESRDQILTDYVRSKVLVAG